MADFLIYEAKNIYVKKSDIINENYSKFTSISNFRDIWDVQNIEKIQNHFFSVGYLAIKIDETFIKSILTTNFENKLYLLAREELSKLEKDTTLQKKEYFRSFLLSYTNESPFYQNLNKFLGQNQFKEIIYMLAAFFKEKSNLNQIIKKECVYRIINLDKNVPSKKWKYEARNQYFPGLHFYWPSFTSTTLSKEALIKFISGKLYPMIWFILK